MKVNETSLNQAAASELAKARHAEALPAAGASESSAAAPAEADRVEVSDLSAKLLHMLSADSPGRTARLERLAAAVRSGTYQVDALTLSRSLVEDALKPQP